MAMEARVGERGRIRTGVGGWTFPPWRGVFYPKGHPHRRELAYAAEHLGAIEINATYYGAQSPESFRKWAAETPEDFLFTVKGNRFCTNRKLLADAGESIDRFFAQGVLELGSKLGPVLWQFAPTKKFDPDDFGAFLDRLPRRLGGLSIRHCVEVRNPTFADPAFAALLRRHEVALVFADHNTYPAFADVTADFVYARLQTGSDEVETAYPPSALKTWAGRLAAWAEGGRPIDLPAADPAHRPKSEPRDVFAFIINEGKINAPAGAMALAALC